jgi:mRNA interferase RelE/StbE
MYSVRIQKQALKYINKLDRPTAKRIRDAIDSIAENPNIGERLTSHGCEYKYRVGSYRILYDVYDNELIIEIVKVNPRGQVYNN